MQVRAGNLKIYTSDLPDEQYLFITRADNSAGDAYTWVEPGELLDLLRAIETAAIHFGVAEPAVERHIPLNPS